MSPKVSSQKSRGEKLLRLLKSLWVWRPNSAKVSIGLLEAKASREPLQTRVQICGPPLREGVQAYKKEGPKFMQRLVAKQKARVQDS